MIRDPAFLDRCAAIVGAGNLLTADADVAGHLREPRGLFEGRTRAVLRPGSTAEVAALARLCGEARVPIVPQGGNTGLVGGQIPDSSGEAVVVSLSRMNRAREVDPASNTMIVEAGMTLAAAQAEAEAVDRLFPLSLASEGSCTIGGNLATNAGGVAVLAYGAMRDLALGLEVVLADGRVMSLLTKLRKDNTGYDLKNLFIGAEGTLGIITAATLKLFPRPRARATAFVGLADPEKALRLFEKARATAGDALTAFELLPRIGLDFVLRHAPGARDPLAAAHAWYALVEFSSQATQGLDEAMARLLGDALGDETIEDAAIAATQGHREDFWTLRERLSEVQGREGGSIKHDVAVPVARVPQFIAEASAAILRDFPGARLVPFGHMGDGNIHFNVSQPAGADKAAFLARWDEANALVHGVVRRLDGSISAEHGIGALKRDELRRVKDPVALAVMEAIKERLDPLGIMNPGKVL